MSLGNTAASLGNLPGAPVVVNYAPQLDLLSRAALTITHAGTNTTLAALSFGVPLTLSATSRGERPKSSGGKHYSAIPSRIISHRHKCTRLQM